MSTLRLLHKYIHRFTHSSQKPENDPNFCQLNEQIKWGTSLQWNTIHIYKELTADTCIRRNESLEHNVECKGLDIKRCSLFDFIKWKKRHI